LNKDCGRCHGKGGREIILKGRGFFGGQLKEWKKCDTCHGSGVNPDYRSKSCRDSWRTIEYSAKTPSEKVPEYCPDCRTRMKAEKEAERERQRQWQNAQRQQQNREREERQRNQQTAHAQTQRPERTQDSWLEKECAVATCHIVIRYKASWNNIPSYCPGHLKEMQQRQHPKYDEASSKEYPSVNAILPGSGKTAQLRWVETMSLFWASPMVTSMSPSRIKERVSQKTGDIAGTLIAQADINADRLTSLTMVLLSSEESSQTRTGGLTANM